MQTIIDESFAQARKIVQEQSNRIASEVNASADGLNTALTRFNTTMKLAQAKDEEAAQLRATAIRELDTAITNSQAIQFGIVQQIADGRMVTGTDTPVIPTRKPKLISGDEEAA